MALPPAASRLLVPFGRLARRTISSAARAARTSSSPVVPSSWPWRRAADTGAGVIREERWIFARPAKVNGRMLWLVVGIWTPLCFFTADNIRFSADRQATEAAEAASSGSRTARPAESSRPSTATNAVTASAIAIANTLDPVAATQSTKNSLVAGVLLTAGLVLPFFVVAWPTRMVTRLTQVRLVPATASATTAGAAKHAPREYIEVETISQAMWRGPWGRPRLIPREDVHVARIWQGRDLSDTPYLKLALTPTAPEHRSILDKWSYRINFMPVRETDYTVPLRDGSLPEVVVSLKRMEEVFGRLRA